MVEAVSAAAAGSTQQTDGGAVRALVDIIKKEETTVHVDMSQKIKAISLKNLPETCFPEPEPTNKLASLRAKAMKNHVAKPFPMVDISDFLTIQFVVRIAM